MSIEALFLRYGPAYRWLATTTVMIATMAVALSATIVNVAIPDVMGAFGIGQVQAQWISTGFLAAMTATMLMSDWAHKALGLRRAMQAALSVFVFGSALGGMAGDEHMLTVARVIQGAAGGVVQPLAMMLLFQVFPSHQRGKAMGVFGIGVVLAPALGPWIGGVLIDAFSWHFVFYLGVPFALAGIVLSRLFLPVRTDTLPVPRFDWCGMALLCVFLGSLLNGLTNAQRLGWDAGAILLQFGVAALALGAFVLRELRAATPMLDLKVFSHLPFVAVALVSFIMGAGLFGSIYLLPLFAQTIQGLTPTQAGLMLMPSGFIMVVIFPLAGHLSDRMPVSVPVALGMAIFAWSSYLTAQLTLDTSFGLLAWWAVVSRIGLGFVFPSLSAGALKVLPPDLVGQGSGTVNFMRQLGGAFGVNLLAVLMERRTAFHADALAATQSSSNPATMELLDQIARQASTASLSDIEQAGVALGFLEQVLVAQASTLAFRDGFLVITIIFLMALGPAWLLHRALASAQQHADSAPSAS